MLNENYPLFVLDCNQGDKQKFIYQKNQSTSIKSIDEKTYFVFKIIIKKIDSSLKSQGSS